MMGGDVTGRYDTAFESDSEINSVVEAYFRKVVSGPSPRRGGSSPSRAEPHPAGVAAGRLGTEDGWVTGSAVKRARRAAAGSGTIQFYEIDELEIIWQICS